MKEPACNTGPSMGAEVAAGKTAFAAKPAVLQKKAFAQVLCDLVKAFQFIPHTAILTAAMKYGYPVKLLRLLLALVVTVVTLPLGAFPFGILLCCNSATFVVSFSLSFDDVYNRIYEWSSLTSDYTCGIFYSL